MVKISPECRLVPGCAWLGEPVEQTEADTALFEHIDKEHPELDIYGDAK